MLYRRRTLDLPHGTLDTPVLFPVRNIGKRSSDNTPEYVESIPDFPVAMINTRSIRNRTPMWERLTGGRSLREEMGVPDDTIVFADSGGFDFASKEVDTTPERTLDTQRQLEADVYGTVDLPLSREKRAAENQRRIEQSIQYALEASDRHDDDALLFASIHGYDPETIRNSIRYLERRGTFDGYALGSMVPIRTDYRKVTKLILAARTATEKPLHVYGLGGCAYLSLLLYLGVDSFDSSSFIRGASHRNYLIPGFGREELRDIENLERLPCPCPICGQRSLDDIREDRTALTRHNLWALATELRRFQYIAESGRDVETYLDLRFEGNEVTKRAYNMAKQQVRRLA
ncbi:tRNA-guanine transglycosylase [Halomarina oriensis]|uniref:tRNA-guanine transglycosylase n=1 Tax=Halomarina oriensis TaxID=671145 RepID=A0A6B0GS30_9EURY|nr:tRNA-guanine transglycosylase [Halomarina oriensis]MWG36107.1 tRNA-guanine transglycosylase [Halomarina oriensis]